MLNASLSNSKLELNEQKYQTINLITKFAQLKIIKILPILESNVFRVIGSHAPTIYTISRVVRLIGSLT